MLSVLPLSGVTANITNAGLEVLVVAAAAGNVYQRIYFDETDGSWDNFRYSIYINFGANFAASFTGNDSYVATHPTNPVSLVTGRVYSFIADVTNTGAASINFNSIGAVPITDVFGSPLPNSTIVPLFVADLQYDGTNLVFLRSRASRQAQQRWFSPSLGWLNIITGTQALRLLYLNTISTPSVIEYLLLEDGFFVLQEDGVSKIIL